MKTILQRMDDLCGLFYNPIKLRAEMPSSCHLVLDFAIHIDMPTPNETCTEYPLSRKGVGYRNKTISNGTKYSDQLLRVEIPRLRKLTDMIGHTDSEAKHKPLAEIFGQLARCQIKF